MYSCVGYRGLTGGRGERSEAEGEAPPERVSTKHLPGGAVTNDEQIALPQPGTLAVPVVTTPRIFSHDICSTLLRPRAAHHVAFCEEQRRRST